LRKGGAQHSSRAQRSWRVSLKRAIFSVQNYRCFAINHKNPTIFAVPRGRVAVITVLEPLADGHVDHESGAFEVTSDPSGGFDAVVDTCDLQGSSGG